MNFWQLLKGRFNGTKRSNGVQEEIARLLSLGFSLLQGENYVEARGLLLRAVQHETKIDNPSLLEWILNSLSLTWEQSEEYQEWTTFFSDFLARNPNHAVALELRAESRWYGGSLREAIDDYSRALELKPNEASAFLGRGQVFVECREFGRAVTDLDSALKALDEIEGADANWKTEFEAFARNGRAAAFAGLGDSTRAMEEFEKSIRLCPDNAWVYFNRAEAYRDQGDQVRAAENYELAIAKKKPKLTALKRAHAKKMLEELGA
jgi:tetratricopeptide (TPR) repeat protein